MGIVDNLLGGSTNTTVVNQAPRNSPILPTLRSGGGSWLNTGLSADGSSLDISSSLAPTARAGRYYDQLRFQNLGNQVQRDANRLGDPRFSPYAPIFGGLQQAGAAYGAPTRSAMNAALAGSNQLSNLAPEFRLGQTMNALPHQTAASASNIQGAANQFGQDVDNLMGQLQNNRFGRDVDALTGQLQGDIAQLRGDLNPFVQATVTPLRQAMADVGAQTEQDYERRGVFGTLRDQAVTRAQMPYQQEIARQGTLATQQALEAIRGRQGMIGGLAQAREGASTQRLGMMGNLAQARGQTGMQAGQATGQLQLASGQTMGGLIRDTLSGILQRQGLVGQMDETLLGSELQRQGLLSQVQGQALDQVFQRQGMLNQINAQLNSLTQQDLQQELAALGLQQDAVAKVLASMAPVSTSSITSTPNMGEGIGNLLGGLGILGYGMGWSDERVKQDIEVLGDAEVDEMLEHLTPVRYKYIGQSAQNYGVLAQDLERSKMGRDLVVEVGGIKTVDLKKLTESLLVAVTLQGRRIKELESGVKHG